MFLLAFCCFQFEVAVVVAFLFVLTCVCREICWLWLGIAEVYAPSPAAPRGWGMAGTWAHLSIVRRSLFGYVTCLCYFVVTFLGMLLGGLWAYLFTPYSLQHLQFVGFLAPIISLLSFPSSFSCCWIILLIGYLSWGEGDPLLCPAVLLLASASHLLCLLTVHGGGYVGTFF